ncbi:efflux RND transporter permease subunit [Candidatus Eisenbacteria bacterium]|uniref:Efflux RND transporter permease subunit n=1 Tax=Eiseniibacteriota bacterium TaxID=2212470 RepID=A0ABV6YIW8_UNCEI
MISAVLQFALKYRLLVSVFFLGVCAAGVLALPKIPIDAFPDISPNLVQVFGEVEGTAAEEVEQQVSRAVEVAMMGIPGVKKIRSISSHGLSTVNIYFEDGFDIYLAHQLVSERIPHAQEDIPEGIDMPHGLEKGPIVSGMGKILAYYLEADNLSKSELRTLQDWVVKRNIQSVTGVADVISQGGFVRQYQVRVNPDLLLKYDLTLDDVVVALEGNNLNLGAGIIERGSEELMVRTVGQVTKISDLESVVLRAGDGVPVYLRNVASVQLGEAFRRGVASLNGEGEVVLGNVYKLHGTNSFEVIQRLKERIEEISLSLPPGVRIVPYYDQSRLVNNSIRTVRDALAIGLVLVCVVSFLFLGNFRNALIVVLSLPFSALLAFALMRHYGIPGDLISLGGIAIALGMIVDGTIIMVERIHSALHDDEGSGSTSDLILTVGKEVGPPIFFAVAVIVLVFAPIFSLGDVEGKMFRPLAVVVGMTMLGSLAYALVVAPVFCSLVLRRGNKAKTTELYNSRVYRGYGSLLQFVLARRGLVIAGVVVLLVIGVLFYGRLGKEFVPTLQEGTIQVLAHMNPNISLREIGRTAAEVEKKILEVEEVKYVLSDIGYGEISPHVHHTNYACITVGLQPRSEWSTVSNQAALAAKIDQHLGEYPGVNFTFSQPIQHEVDELVAGAGGTVVARLFGADLDQLTEKVKEIEEAMAHIDGVADLRTEQFAGQTQVQIRLKDEQIARHGLTKAEVQQSIHTALAGDIVGSVFEGEKTFGIDVRLDEDYRQNIEEIGGLMTRTPGGYTVPLDQLADIETVTGLRQISRENTRRFISVQCNVRGRDPGGFVEEARAKIAETVSLPPGYRLVWGGQFELQEAANRRLSLILPMVLLGVLLMIYLLFRSVANVLLITFNIPLALVGGVLALTIFGENVSIPSSIGFIALFGIALTDGLILVSRFEHLRTGGMALRDAVVNGGRDRLRAVIMTTVTTALGLLPLILTTGMGSEIQRPLAIVVVGGLVSSTLLTLVVLPTLYLHVHSWRKQPAV